MSDLKYYSICAVDELSPRERLFIKLGETPVVVFNIAGEFFAIADTCTHDQGPLGEGEVEDYEIICPRHGARFDIRTGEVLTLPAVTDVPTYTIRVAEGRVEIGMSED